MDLFSILEEEIVVNKGKNWKETFLMSISDFFSIAVDFISCLNVHSR